MQPIGHWQFRTLSPGSQRLKVKTALRLLVLFSASLIQSGSAAEIDSVTPRSIELDNSLPAINRIFTQRLQQGIDKANAQQADFDEMQDSEFCDEEILYTELRKAIFDSLTAAWGLKGYDLDKQLRRLLASQSYHLSLNDSVYRDINYLEGFSLNLKELSDVVNINGHLVGLDKIGHFFAQGWQYFELTQRDGRSIDQALDWGEEQEAGVYGYTTTGIFSFSDLVANFNGWRFWNRILLREDDPLKGFMANLFNRPYVSCEIQLVATIMQRKIVWAWEVDSRFDLSDYLDGTWDEGNNCNSYKDPLIEHKVAARIKRVRPGFSCPFIPDHCVDARRKYGRYAKRLLHPYCLIAGDR